MIQASMNHTDQAWIILYSLPAVLPMPLLMFWLATRSFLRSEAQSRVAIIGLMLMGIIACFYLNAFHMPRFGRSSGIFDIWLLLLLLGLLMVPVTVAWEAHKQGWFDEWKRKKKNRL